MAIGHPRPAAGRSRAPRPQPFLSREKEDDGCLGSLKTKAKKGLKNNDVGKFGYLRPKQFVNDSLIKRGSLAHLAIGHPGQLLVKI